jgi:hypothetical protein
VCSAAPETGIGLVRALSPGNGAAVAERPELARPLLGCMYKLALFDIPLLFIVSGSQNDQADNEFDNVSLYIHDSSSCKFFVKTTLTLLKRIFIQEKPYEAPRSVSPFLPYDPVFQPAAQHRCGAGERVEIDHDSDGRQL